MCKALTIEHRQAFEKLAVDTKAEIANKSFRPEKFTDPRGARLFTMVPIYSFQLRYTDFNQQTFMPVLRKAGLFRGGKISHEQLRRVIWQNFNFQKIGFHSEESLKTERKEFWYKRILYIVFHMPFANNTYY